MTLSELRYVVAVGRERHFGKAAKACFVSQPTLSVAIKKLEEELGVAIFERGSNEVLVTEVGERILDQARKVLSNAGEIKQIAIGDQDDHVKPLKIGVIYTVGPYLLPNLIPSLRETAEELPIIIEENYTHVLREKLKQGDLDAIIVSLPFDATGFNTTPLYDEPFVVVVPTSHPWRMRDNIHPDDFRDELVLLLGKGHCFRDQVIEACPQVQQHRRQEDLQRTLEGGSLETIRHMVASGVGVTVLPRGAAGVDEYAQRMLKIIRFGGPVIPKRRVVLATRKGYRRGDVIQILRQSVLQCNMTSVEMMDYSGRTDTEADVRSIRAS